MSLNVGLLGQSLMASSAFNLIEGLSYFDGVATGLGEHGLPSSLILLSGFRFLEGSSFGLALGPFLNDDLAFGFRFVLLVLLDLCLQLFGTVLGLSRLSFVLPGVAALAVSLASGKIRFAGKGGGLHSFRGSLGRLGTGAHFQSS